MEVDKGQGKGKSNIKGKGKSKGKDSSKTKGKSKSKGKDSNKSKGKNKGKGTKPTYQDKECYVRGEKGHFARDCWSRAKRCKN